MAKAGSCAQKAWPEDTREAVSRGLQGEAWAAFSLCTGSGHTPCAPERHRRVEWAARAWAERPAEEMAAVRSVEAAAVMAGAMTMVVVAAAAASQRREGGLEVRW